MTLPDFPEPADSEPAAAATPPRKSPSRYEQTLVPRLVGALQALNARFGSILATVEHEPAASAATVEDCARQFTAVRHIETIWLYPIIAQAVEADADARGQLAELRLIGLILARRVLRSFDELNQAIRAEALVGDTALRLGRALAKYSNHSEQVVYPLYELIGSERQDSAEAA